MSNTPRGCRQARLRARQSIRSMPCSPCSKASRPAMQSPVRRVFLPFQSRAGFPPSCRRGRTSRQDGPRCGTGEQERGRLCAPSRLYNGLNTPANCRAPLLFSCPTNGTRQSAKPRSRRRAWPWKPAPTGVCTARCPSCGGCPSCLRPRLRGARHPDSRPGDTEPWPPRSATGRAKPSFSLSAHRQQSLQTPLRRRQTQVSGLCLLPKRCPPARQYSCRASPEGC